MKHTILIICITLLAALSVQGQDNFDALQITHKKKRQHSFVINPGEKVTAVSDQGRIQGILCQITADALIIGEDTIPLTSIHHVYARTTSSTVSGTFLTGIGISSSIGGIYGTLRLIQIGNYEILATPFTGILTAMAINVSIIGIHSITRGKRFNQMKWEFTPIKDPAITDLAVPYI